MTVDELGAEVLPLTFDPSLLNKQVTGPYARWGETDGRYSETIVCPQRKIPEFDALKTIRAKCPR
jgi:hypothetical protein